MQIKAKTPEEYIENVPNDRREAMKAIRQSILENLPEGFEEIIGYGMIGYVVPHSIYPKGYHADPKLPLPFINLASQKNHIALYHMGLYSSQELLSWFTDEYSKQTKLKPDMGKGCVRFKNPEKIPLKLIGELVSRVSVKEWISNYEKNRGRRSI
jgi:uncharacterized protein YdhG (YjbR/CyaY superfamily)